MIDFLTTHYAEILGAALALLGLLNAYATRHPDDVSHPVARALLVALDVLSWLQSRDARQAPGAPRGLRPKVPLLQRSAASGALDQRVRTSTMREGVLR